MKIRELNKQDAQDAYIKLCGTHITDEYFDALDQDYKKIRFEILRQMPSKIEKNFDFDLKFAMVLYRYFSNENITDFNETVASNYDFWRYICIKVLPDVIIERHGLVDTYFYSKNVRLYIPTLWWFIELGYQGDLESTYECLKNFSTDFILQFVERPGKDGLYIDVTRLVLGYLSSLPKAVVNKKIGNQTLIRRLLIQHTAKSANYNLVVEGETNKYVVELFKSCGVEV